MGVDALRHPQELPGDVAALYTRWRYATRDRLDPAVLGLLSPLAKLVPPAGFDKPRYSAFAEPHLLQLMERKAEQVTRRQSPFISWIGRAVETTMRLRLGLSGQRRRRAHGSDYARSITFDARETCILSARGRPLVPMPRIALRSKSCRSDRAA
jgi:hypothetical protein